MPAIFAKPTKTASERSVQYQPLKQSRQNRNSVKIAFKTITCVLSKDTLHDFLSKLRIELPKIWFYLETKEEDEIVVEEKVQNQSKSDVWRSDRPLM